MENEHEDFTTPLRFAETVLGIAIAAVISILLIAAAIATTL